MIGCEVGLKVGLLFVAIGGATTEGALVGEPDGTGAVLIPDVGFGVCGLYVCGLYV